MKGRTPWVSTARKKKKMPATSATKRALMASGLQRAPGGAAFAVSTMRPSAVVMRAHSAGLPSGIARGSIPGAGATT